MTAYDDYGMPVGAYSEPETLTHQARRVARAFALYRVKPEAERMIRGLRSENWTWRKLLSLVKVAVVVWWFAVYYGERSAIQNSVEQCRWENWENWVCSTRLLESLIN